MFKHAPWFFENSVFVRDSSIQAPTCLRTVHVSFQLLVAFGRTNLRGIFVYICIYIYMIVYIYIYLYYIASYRCFPANILALKKNIQTKYCILNFFHDCDCCGSIFHVTIWNWNSFGALSLFLHWHVSGAHGLVGASAPSLKIHVEGWIGCWLLQVRGTEGPKCLDWDAPLVGLWKVKVNKGILY